MNPFGILAVAVTALVILIVPRRWVPAALMVGACYVTRAQELDIGPFTFTIVRILLVVATLRVLVRGEWALAKVDRLDISVSLLACLLVFTVMFHNDPANQVVERLGMAFDLISTYLLMRCLCTGGDDVGVIGSAVGVLLIPIAGCMLFEKLTGHNLFAFLGGVYDLSVVRDGHVRAQGPFTHAILAGTTGAVLLPLAANGWRRNRPVALAGGCACLAIVIASGSSGPILSAAASLGALLLWRWRRSLSVLRWGAVTGYVALDLVMKDPAYFILARIDLTGGSTGWHRARLIQSSLEHLSEWWLAGTDYTRHWMPSGVSWSRNHTDITNHYLYMGVLGGLPVMLAFASVLWAAFVRVGRHVLQDDQGDAFAVWALGSALFTHAVTLVSVAYYDSTSVLFLYLTFGTIAASTKAAPALARTRGVAAVSANMNYRRSATVTSRPQPTRPYALRVSQTAPIAARTRSWRRHG